MTRAQPQPGGPPPPGGARQLPAAAFSEKLVAPFPRGGCAETPVHRASSDFEWRDYAPTAFRYVCCVCAFVCN